MKISGEVLTWTGVAVSVVVLIGLGLTLWLGTGSDGGNLNDVLDSIKNGMNNKSLPNK